MPQAHNSVIRLDGPMETEDAAALLPTTYELVIEDRVVKYRLYRPQGAIPVIPHNGGSPSKRWKRSNIVSAIERSGGLDLSAVIVHGSIGFGDYVAGRSDLDLLVVGEVPTGGVAEVAESMIAVPAAAGIEGLECSLVSRDDIASLEPARYFRLHAIGDHSAVA